MAINIKNIAKKALFSCFVICSLSFSACKVNADQTNNQIDESKYATVYISINNNEFTSSLSERYARTATPVLPATITYSLVATKIENGATTSTTKSSDPSFSQEDPAFASEKRYMIKLPEGTWRVTVTGKNSSGQQILSGTSQDFNVTANGYYNETVPVYFISDNSGKGRINLEIETTDTDISYVIISGTGQNNLDKRFDAATSGNRRIIKLYNSETNNITSGSYPATLTFYDDNDAIVTIIMETINIRNFMVTDHWYKTNYALYLQEKTGTRNGEADFILTQEIIDSLENSTLYVRGNNAQSTLITGSGSDSANDGTRVAPYYSLKAAINRVNALNNVNYAANDADSTNYGRKTFTIYCDGEIGNETSSAAITVSPDHNLDLTIQSIDTSHAAVVSVPSFILTGSQTNNITLKNINLKGNIELRNGALVLNSVPVQALTSDTSKGQLLYYDGQLTLGGATSFINGIKLNAADKRIRLDSAITSTGVTAISAGTAADGTSLASSYTDSTVIIEGAGSSTVTGSYSDVSSTDLSTFIWGNPDPLTGNTDYYALRLKAFDGKVKAVLGKTNFSITEVPVWDDISFVLQNYEPAGTSTTSNPPHYEYKITGYSSSDDGISGNITIKMYVKKGTQKLKEGDNTITLSNNVETTVSLDSISLTLYGDSETPIAPTETAPCTVATVTETLGDPSTSYDVVTLTASGIRPGVYILKMSAIIDSIAYSQQSAAVYASLGAS